MQLAFAQVRLWEKALGQKAAISDLTFYPGMPGNSTLHPSEKALLQADSMPAAFFNAAEVHATDVVTLNDVLEGYDCIDLLKVRAFALLLVISAPCRSPLALTRAVQDYNLHACFLHSCNRLAFVTLMPVYTILAPSSLKDQGVAPPWCAAADRRRRSRTGHFEGCRQDNPIKGPADSPGSARHWRPPLASAATAPECRLQHAWKAAWSMPHGPTICSTISTAILTVASYHAAAKALMVCHQLQCEDDAVIMHHVMHEGSVLQRSVYLQSTLKGLPTMARKRYMILK